MKMMLTSDTHYGHSKNTHKVHERFLKEIQQEIIHNDIKVLIHSGDWISNQQHQFERTVKMFRDAIDIPIVAVRGNHCLWDYRKDKWDDMRGIMVPNRKMSWESMDARHREMFEKYNIHHLEHHGQFVIEDIVILGFDGWYYHMNAPTNDGGMIVPYVGGATSMMFHSHRAYTQLDKILAIDTEQYRKAVCVTHHPPFASSPQWEPYSANPRFLEPIKEKFDVLCTGHSHRYRNDVEGETLILNCGSGYDKPKYIIFEV